tara:strand:+ start:12708 stop:14777 length:2070 start_codon:yes stop_codon:yes gene_type:complete
MASIAYANLQYEDKAGWYLKAYVSGQTTAKIMYSDKEQSQGFSKIQLDSEGFPASSGGSRFIPFINGYFDLYLIPTEEEADEDILDNAIRLAQNITSDSLLIDTTKASTFDYGVTRITSSQEINTYYDWLEGLPVTPFFPAVPDVPNIYTNRTQIARELDFLGIGGSGALQVGDGIYTVRDVGNSFVPERAHFNRALYPELDTAMGAYFPIDEDFTSAIYSQTVIDSANTSDNGTFTNSWATRGFGFVQDKIYLMRYDYLYIINKETMLIEHTLTPTTANFGFQVCEVLENGELLVVSVPLNGSGAANNIELYTVSNDFTTLDHKVTMSTYGLNTNVSTSNYMAFNIIQDPATQDINLVVTLNLDSSTQDHVFDIFWVKFNYSETARTSFFNSEMYDTFVQMFDRTESAVFFNKNKNKIDLYLPPSTNYSVNLPAYNIAVPSTLINEIDGTSSNVVSTNGITNRFEQKFDMLDEGAEFIDYQGNYLPVYREDRNQIIIFKAIPQTSSTLPASSFNYINAIVYDLDTFKVVDTIYYPEFERFGIEKGAPSVDSILVTNSYSVNTDNRIRKYDTLTFDSKAYIPLVTDVNTSTGRRISFVNLDDGLQAIDNSYPYDIGFLSGSGNPYGYTMQRMNIVDNETVYWLDGNSKGSDNGLSIYKLDLVDNPSAHLTRPAPILNATLPTKGFIRGK